MGRLGLIFTFFFWKRRYRHTHNRKNWSRTFSIFTLYSIKCYIHYFELLLPPHLFRKIKHGEKNSLFYLLKILFGGLSKTNWRWFICIVTPRIRLILLLIAKDIWCACKLIVSFYLESLNFNKQSALLSFQNYGFVFQIFDLALGRVASVCLDFCLHRIDPRVQ